MQGGRPVIFYNIPLNKLKEACINSLKGGEVIWFASDVLASSMRKDGLLLNNLFKKDELFGVKTGLDKHDRLTLRTSFCNHAMTLTGVNILADGTTDKWKVENSWGKENGFDGFFVMDDAWFDNYVYQVIINKKYVDKEIVEDYERAELVEVAPYNTLFAEID